ncbi:non-canonical purine NTP pyrophosphatase [Polycladomyces subterraneus]|uniref:Non-canonical purine NTP pyrophosphatase n=1 Tax=Polycladomyces subterraneus TaxID=1016997 RepID=A0ABT8INM1_9BACL|nr:non-canonical purine NTP pyrophosphatase [Polycladomyces subterraneus]MDN4594358.1 hypothetical protein [Polycladomyces subterraneus]
MKLQFATQNEGKLAEAKRVLSRFGIEVIGLPVDLWEPSSGEIETVTLEKLRQIRRMGYDRVMVDDAGIFFAAYDHFPGVLTKRVFDRIGYRGVRKLLEGEDRTAWFEGCIAVSWDGETGVFAARTSGRILDPIPDDIRPEPGLPFNPIFIPDGETRVLGAMTPEEQMKYSYRCRALEQMAEWLLNQA